MRRSEMHDRLADTIKTMPQPLLEQLEAVYLAMYSRGPVPPLAKKLPQYLLVACVFFRISPTTARPKATTLALARFTHSAMRWRKSEGRWAPWLVEALLHLWREMLRKHPLVVDTPEGVLLADIPADAQEAFVTLYDTAPDNRTWKRKIRINKP